MKHRVFLFLEERCWRLAVDLHRSVDLGQHVQSFVVLVEFTSHREIATVDEEVRRWERRLEWRGWVAMFLRAQRCVVGVADDEDSSIDGWSRHGCGREPRCEDEGVAWSTRAMFECCESVAESVAEELWINLLPCQVYQVGVVHM